MFYVPSVMPKATPYDFSKSYNPAAVNPQVAQNLTEVQQLRDNFWGQVEHIGQQGDHSMIEQVDWMTWMTYLSKTPDMLEHGITANFPYDLHWHSGAYPGAWHVVNNDNE